MFWVRSLVVIENVWVVLVFRWMRVFVVLVVSCFFGLLVFGSMYVVIFWFVLWSIYWVVIGNWFVWKWVMKLWWVWVCILNLVVLLYCGKLFVIYMILGLNVLVLINELVLIFLVRMFLLIWSYWCVGVMWFGMLWCSWKVLLGKDWFIWVFGINV